MPSSVVSYLPLKDLLLFKTCVRLSVNEELSIYISGAFGIEASDAEL
jgi:hypothetical protein